MQKRNYRPHGISQGEYQQTYNSWNQMVQRCTNPRIAAYDRYGAVGIKPCQYLAADPRNLVALLGLKPTDEHSLDRHPDCRGGYTCGQCEECQANGWKCNVRWATDSEQNRNRKDRVLWHAFGKEQLMVEWAAEYGMGMQTLWHRLRVKGMLLEEALTTPVRKRSKTR